MFVWVGFPFFLPKLLAGDVGPLAANEMDQRICSLMFFFEHGSWELILFFKAELMFRKIMAKLKALAKDNSILNPQRFVVVDVWGTNGTEQRKDFDDFVANICFLFSTVVSQKGL